jgi:hypothetical protein
MAQHGLEQMAVRIVEIDAIPTIPHIVLIRIITITYGHKGVGVTCTPIMSFAVCM